MCKKAVIIGAGPAGLTAAYELLTRTDIIPIIYECSDMVGGLSRTINYKGNRIDIGGHRFFTKSEKVLDWWEKFLPRQGAPSSDDILLGRKIGLSEKENAPDPERVDDAMLIRRRKSRIFSRGKFFQYPLTFTPETFSSLGFSRTIRVAVGYFGIHLFPRKEEKNLEDFFVNRFGKELYTFFFKDYSRKLWGRSCKYINVEWGRQRIKEVSIKSLIHHALRRACSFSETVSFSTHGQASLIESFLYPKLGPGQLWEKVAKQVAFDGGGINLNQKVTRVMQDQRRVCGVEVFDTKTGASRQQEADYIFSTMPMRHLLCALEERGEIRDLATRLDYRAFISVAFVLRKLKLTNQTSTRTVNGLPPDNWIYLHDMSIKAGRFQIFNNWSPYLVADDKTVLVALEYFCSEGDRFWNQTDSELMNGAAQELSRIGFADRVDVLDGTVIREPNAYPVYAGAYNQFSVLRKYVDQFANLFLIGRGGMHRYNNSDHSMLTAMAAVGNVAEGIQGKQNIWDINVEQKYQEGK